MKVFVSAVTVVFLMFTMLGCEEAEETDVGGFLITNSSGGEIEVSVDGETYTLADGENETISWEMTLDEGGDYEVTASGMFVLDYSTSRYVWGSGSLVELDITANAASIRFINNTNTTLEEIYLSDYTNNAYDLGAGWGDNYISGMPVASGASYDFITTPASYDIKVIDGDGNIYSEKWVDLPWFDAGNLYEMTIG